MTSIVLVFSWSNCKNMTGLTKTFEINRHGNTCQSAEKLTGDCGLKAALDYSCSPGESNKYICACTQHVAVRKKRTYLSSHTIYTLHICLSLLGLP